MVHRQLHHDIPFVPRSTRSTPGVTEFTWDEQTGPGCRWRRSRQASSVGDGLCPPAGILDEPASVPSGRERAEAG
jgi:hypothetical protein